MAENTTNEEVIIDIPLDNLISQLKYLSDQFAINKNELDKMKAAMKDSAKTVAELSKQNKALGDRSAEVSAQLAAMSAAGVTSGETWDALTAESAALTAKMAENTAAIAENTAKMDAMDRESLELSQTQKVLRQEIGGVEKQIQNNIKQEKAQEGSLVQLRAQLANLNKQYDSMSGFERMGTAGVKLQERIKGLSDQIGGLEASTGRYQRNVGNYKSALEGLSGSFKTAGLSTNGLDASLKLLNMNPIMTFLTVVVGAVKALVNAVKDNESATMALREALAPLNPLFDSMKRGADAFAKVLANVVGVAIRGLTETIGTLLTGAQKVANFFGADVKWGDNFRDAADAAAALQKSEDDYIKAKREWSVESAKIDRDVADLRAKVAEKDKYSAEERLEMLDQAIALEERKAAKQKEFAEWELRNAQAEAQRSENSTAANEKLAEAERAVIEADTALSESKRRLNAQRAEAVKQMEAESGKAGKLKSSLGGLTDKVKELRKELELIKEVSLSEAVEAAEKTSKEAAEKAKAYNDQIASSFEDGIRKSEVLGEYLEEMELKAPQVEMPDVSDDFGEEQISALDKFAAKFVENADTIEQTASAMGSSFGSLSSIYSQMAKDESLSEEERAKAAKKAKTWAALQIAANSGTAVAKGIASAMDTPFPANIAAIASTLAAVLAAVAQAKALAAEGYEDGGVIGGFRGARMRSDDTYIHAAQGEMMLNAVQQRRLFDIASGTARPSTAAQLAEAIASMPAPVLEYAEFVRFQGRVATLDEGSVLR